MNKLFFLLLAFYFQATSQTIDLTWVKEHYSKKECQIPMRDGVKLFTAVYSPKDFTTGASRASATNAEKHPFLMVRTPYSCAPYGEKEFF